MGVVMVTCQYVMIYIFNFSAPNHIFGISEARHFKFRVLIDTEY